MAESLELQGLQPRPLILVGNVPNFNPEVAPTQFTLTVNNNRPEPEEETHNIHPENQNEDSVLTPGTSNWSGRPVGRGRPLLSHPPVRMKSPEYNMSHPRRGTILLFFHENFQDDLNKKPRNHGWKDVEALKSFFENLGFVWTFYTDPLVSDIVKSLEEALTRGSVAQENHTDSDCVWIAVSTYGAGNNLYARDGTYPASLLWKYFEPQSCPTLAGKPCIVLVQADQAAARHPGSSLIGMLDEMALTKTPAGKPDKIKDMSAVKHVPSYMIPKKADILVVHNTSSSHAVHGDLTQGSHFLQTFCSVFNDTERLQTLPFHELLLLVTQELYATSHPDAGPFHIPILWTTTMREIFFRNAEFSGRGYSGPVQIPPDSTTLKYPTDKQEVGYAHIFHHDHFRDLEDRKGSKYDNERIKETLKNAGFKVQMHDNKTAAKLKVALKEAARKDYSQYNCLIVVVMTHGTRKDGDRYSLKLQAWDHLYPLDEIWKRFDKCSTLQNKPKIFLIHACLGDNYDTGFGFLGHPEDDYLKDQSAAADHVPHKHEEATHVENSCHANDWKEPLAADRNKTRGDDMFIVTSAFPDYKAFRAHSEGSWFIQEFCNVFGNKTKRLTKSFYSIMMEVNRKVGITNIAEGWKQSPLIVTTCQREIVFRQ